MEHGIKTDVFIAGAGPAGIAAAVAAAELGLTVCLAEKNNFPGGRATASAVGTICGLFLRSQASPEFAMQGFPKHFAAKLSALSKQSPVLFSDGLWFLPSHPDDFEKTARHFLTHQNIRVFYNTPVREAKSFQSKVTEVHCTNSPDHVTFIPKCVIDCSGEGVMCSLLNHNIIRDEEYQAAAIVFSLKNVSGDDEYQVSFKLLKNITRHIDDGKVPEYYHLIGLIPHSLSNGSVQLKMGLPWKIRNEDIGSVNRRAKELVTEIYKFLKKSVPGFEASEVEWVAEEAGIRTGMRAKGMSLLKNEDVLSCKKTDDSVCNGAWPVEYWRTGNKRVEMTFLPERDYYSIPAGCLESGEIENLFFAGKIISAEEKAIASARVIGTCLGTGYAAGALASYKAMNKGRDLALEYIQNHMLGAK